MAKILLTTNAEGNDISIEDGLIITAFTKDSVTTIEYLSEEDGYRKEVGVAQTLANVGNMSKKLISVTAWTGNPIADSGESDASSTHVLTDATQNFDVTVTVGDRVHNTTDDTWATVLTVTSATELALNNNILEDAGDNYIIYANTGDTVWVNKDRINSIDEVNELATLYLEASSASGRRLLLATNAVTVKAAIIAKGGDYTYLVGSYTVDPYVILTAAAGDVTALFTSGVRFTVFGEDSSNDSIYSVASSSYSVATGLTTITTNETPTAATSYGGYVWLKGAGSTSGGSGGTTFTIPITYSNATGITAFATGGQASATALIEEINDVTICATSGDSVKLPTASAGLRITVKNSGAASLDVFPNTSDSINALAVNLAVAVPPGSISVFFAKNATVWECVEVVAADDGSVALPSYTFKTQEDMGFYLVSAAQLGVSVSGALTTVFDTSGVSTDSVRARVELITAGTNVTAVSYGDGKNFVTELTLAAAALVSLTGIGAEATGALIATFPAGAHIHTATAGSVAFQGGGTVDADTPELGIGSTLAAGASATLGAAGATTEDYTDGTAVADCSGTALVIDPVGASAGILTGISLNATGDVKTVYLNAADTWAGADTLTATGTVYLHWSIMSA